MSHTNADVGGTKRSRQTCLNCRRKKVKCYGEQPACAFCARLGQECVYPGRSRTYSSQSRPGTDASVNQDEYKRLVERVALLESSLSNFQINSSRQTGLSDHGDGNSPTSAVDHIPLTLPPPEVVSGTLDLYFLFCHNQPYAFFHEASFRQDLATGIVPDYLIYTLLTIAIRFSHHPFYQHQKDQLISKYAQIAWKLVLQQCFDKEEGPDYHTVQAATLLAIHDFTACKHNAAWIKIGLAVSMAQAQHLMSEPPPELPCVVQEERRRTLWSIYLLDKMATCGRGRPSLFQDKDCELQLPCSENAFLSMVPENVTTLEAFKTSDEELIENLDSFAHTITIASVLSQLSAYMFQQSKATGEMPPWDHASEYQIICSLLTRFETYFQNFRIIQEDFLAGSSLRLGDSMQYTEAFIFSYVLYNLCFCLLQHPFLLWRRIESSGKKTPAKFFATASSSCWEHAQELTWTLANAKQAGYNVSATIFSYCSIVAGTINCLFQFSQDERVRMKSSEGLRGNLVHLEQKSIYWKNANRMASALKQFSDDAVCYTHLISMFSGTITLTPMEIERLYGLCDYGTMSTDPKCQEETSTTFTCGPQYPTSTVDVDLLPILTATDSSIEHAADHSQLSPFSWQALDHRTQNQSTVASHVNWDVLNWNDGQSM